MEDFNIFCMGAGLNFTHRKLPQSAAENLKACPVDTVKAYAMMTTPMYVYFETNEKFVAIKAPLDFFTAEELAKLKGYQSFFVPAFSEEVAPFCKVARSFRNVLRVNSALPIASYEVNDAAIRLIGPLLGNETKIESFFVVSFVAELCPDLNSELVLKLRNKSISDFERAIFISSWCVWLSILLGNSELEFLARVRRDSFLKASGTPAAVSENSWIHRSAEGRDVFRISEKIVLECGLNSVGRQFFAGEPSAVSAKVSARLDRIARDFSPQEKATPSIFGEKGFVHG